MEPVLAVFAGYALSHDYVKPGADSQPYVQEALDEIEYVTGDASTKWGAQRVKDGYPEPFKLRYVEIGNEDWFDISGSYDGRFAQFYDAIYCTVELKIPRQSPALIVPASAIIFNQNGMQVAVVENGVAHLRKVAITTDYGTEVEVNEGVKDGDQVVLQPPVNLADGDKVQIIPEPPAATP